jgi:Protein of unknown function (DUF4238)
MAEQRKNKHHYFPVHHLRHFGDRTGCLWVYDRTGLPPRQDSPKKIGFEKFLYAPESGSNPKDDAVENWLEREIDAPSAGLLLKLLDADTLSAEEKSRFAAYITIQDMIPITAVLCALGCRNDHAEGAEG